jgi:hypothetical protein
MAGAATLPTPAPPRRTRAIGVDLRLGEVHIVGPSMANVRQACGEIWNDGFTAATAGTPASPPGNVRRRLTPGGRKRIGDAQRKRRQAEAKSNGRAAAKTMTATG